MITKDEFKHQFRRDIVIALDALDLAADFLENYIDNIKDIEIQEEERNNMRQISKDFRQIKKIVTKEAKTNNIDKMKELITHLFVLIDDIYNEFETYDFKELLKDFYTIDRDFYAVEILKGHVDIDNDFSDGI